jgi:hypothetical protein
MTTPDAPRPTFVIDPIRQEVVEDSEVARMLEHVCQELGMEPFGPTPPPVVGWRLTLTVDDQPVEQREFDGAADGFQSAQDAGRAWLAQHGGNGIDQWLASSFQASRRMGWDHAYQLAIRRRGF